MIDNKNFFIFDGAFGTYYANICKNPLSPCELANIHDQNTVLNIHREYIAAGCQAIRTNTFAANRVTMKNDLPVLKEVIRQGYRLAQESALGTEVMVFADVGPIARQFEEDLWEGYQEIVDEFLSLGASHFIFETFSSDEYLPELCAYIKEQNPQAYILVEFSVSPEGFTRIGLPGKKLLYNMFETSVIDAGGFNCFSGPHHLLEFIKTFDIQNRTVSIMPNSGYPTIIDNRTFFENTKEYFAAKMLDIAKHGVRILGGCCGTTPEYIREMVARLQHIIPSETKYEVQAEKTSINRIESPNILVEKLKRGEKVIAVELDPPVDTDIAFFMDSARLLKSSGVDAITIADCPLARARVDSSLMACKIKREVDITPIPHLTCRDRNINATKALLLGLNIEGINNVLIVTGDPIPSAQREEIQGIFDFNSAILANYISNLNETVFSSPFNICAALNVNSKNFEVQLGRAQKKIDNGAAVFLTQPVLSRRAVENIALARERLAARILGGILPIVSYKNACFVNNEISGISVADEIVEQYRGLSKEEGGKLAVEISNQMVRSVYPFVDGFYLITPFKRIDLVVEIIKYIQSLEP
ncbi:MAG: bifunctional homocysteine S-methyltransferase/methylenetetrahydrofolate reductase [Syntrophomonadaceae bacterium]|nr:bifunctional homocysteine S-methyltransferase/methylenetetrahydrofolate reductase [Syntrophomonadaceae bacterium]